MPRAARCVIAGWPLHIVQRGINRNDCFFAERDYTAYLAYLHRYSIEFGCTLHAYCLMTNHVHLLLTPGAPEACAQLMKSVGQCYVQGVNQRLARTGTLWEGRFRSCVVTSDTYVLTCYRYIELNPVRAAMVAAPAEYRWSSYAANADGQGPSVCEHPAYQALGSDPALRRSAYKVLCDSAPPAEVVEEIRKATRLGGVAGAVRRKRGRPKPPK